MKITTKKEEQNYLNHVKLAIQDRMSTIRDKAKSKSKEMAEYKEYLRENKDEKAILHQSIGFTATTGKTQVALLEKLNRLMQNPYFGRINFEHNNREKTIYIGVSNFIAEQDMKKTNLIYDWRAPISSMFYDFGIGNAMYNSPSGEVFGKINLKRQYKIRKGKMLYMLDTSEHIYDELLQGELSLQSNEKMKSIVATIQREQNKIIRDETSKTLIIQGVAGSGKTSIALHRVAFMLYKFNDTISSKNILILSPNKVFSNYIANVLPELGEENIPEKTIIELVEDFLDYKYTVQSLFEQVAIMLKKDNKSFSKKIRFKSSKEFVRKLDEYVIYLNDHYFTPSNISIGRYTIPMEAVEKEYKSLFRLPLLKRNKELANRLKQYVYFKFHYELSAKEKMQLAKQVKRMHGSTNLNVLYKRFYAWLGRKELLTPIIKNQIEYLDAFGIVYLKMMIQGSKSHRKIKHLVIDEMQDYSPIQFAVIKKMFHCNMTLLGDINQSLTPQSKINLNEVKKLFFQSRLATLNKSYRSTYEIIHFTQKIAFIENMIPMERHGEPPYIFKEKDMDAEKNKIVSLVSTFLREKKFHSLGIICKTDEEAKIIKSELDRNQISSHYITQDSTKFTDGVTLTCAQLSKGLEFDSVIIPFVNQTNYKSEIDRNMLYISCTRAMQQLTLVHSGKLSQLIM